MSTEVTVVESQDDADTTTQDGVNPDQNDGGEDGPEEFDREYVEKLRRENARYRTAAKQNADAAKELARLQSKDATDAERISAAEKRAEEAEAKALRREVAIDEGLSNKDDIEFLDLTTDEDTMRRLAKRLAKSSRKDDTTDAGLTRRVGAKPSSHSRGSGTGSPGATSDEARAKTLFGV